VASLQNLYTQIKDGDKADNFEKWLDKNFESPAHDVIDRAINGDILSISDWQTLIRFLASQDVRTPLNYVESLQRWKKEIPETLQKILDELLLEMEQRKNIGNEPRLLPSPDDIFAESLNFEVIHNYDPEKNLGAIKVEALLGRQLWLNSLRFLLENTAKILLKHKWCIVEAADNSFWITSDHPVVRLNYYKDDSYDLKGGWGVKNGDIFMPLSPRYMLYTEIGKNLPNRLKFTEDRTNQFNKFIAEKAYRSIFASEINHQIEKIRPRRINKKQYREEQRLWREWDKEQSIAEEHFQSK
jgi:hypothetical protein